MSSGAVPRDTKGARPRPPTATVGVLPQEAVTPTRRDLRAVASTRNTYEDPTSQRTNVDWIPVSEYNSRPSNVRSRKPINALPENNEFVELDQNIATETSNRFVPVRPQPRTLVLRQRDIMENQEEALYNPILSGHSPHSNHAAIMIVNPTTPNSNIPNQNLHLMNGHSIDNQNSPRNIYLNHDTNSASAIPIVPVGGGNRNKSNNISNETQDSLHQNSPMQNNAQNPDSMNSQSKTVRSIGDSLVAACPDTARVEQRLGQIQEYIRVTANLVDSIRNSEDELQNRLAHLQRSNHIFIEAAYQDEHNDVDELEKTLKDLKDSEKKLLFILNSSSSITESQNENDLNESIIQEVQISEIDENTNNGQVINEVSQIIIDKNAVDSLDTKNNDALKKSDSNDQMQLRRCDSQERDKDNKSISNSIISESSASDILRDLKMRRQHLENQVAKIQSLHAATASLVDAMDGDRANSILNQISLWEESEESIPEDDGAAAVNCFKSKMEAVNVIKVELERLKSMLRTADSIQNNFDLISTFEEENSYENGNSREEEQDNHNINHNIISESHYNNISRSKGEPSSSSVNQCVSNSSKHANMQHGLPRLQNCITGNNKCTNVDDQQQRDYVNSSSSCIPVLTHKNKDEDQVTNNDWQKLKHTYNRDANNSSTSSVKTEDKRQSNSAEKITQSYPSDAGPVERKQIALKAELEAKKKQLEQLMSKVIDHRTNHQIQMKDLESNMKTCAIANENSFSPQPNSQQCRNSESHDFNENDMFPCHIRSDADNGYSSEQDIELEFNPLPVQVNVNQLSDRNLPKKSSRNSSIESFKIAYNNDSQTAETSNQLMKHVKNHSNLFETTSSEKLKNKEDVNHEPRNLRESCQRQLSNSNKTDSNVLQSTQTLPSCFVSLPANSSMLPPQTKQMSQNKSINPPDSTDVTSHVDSGSSSGDQDLPDIPNPMPELTLRHTTKNDEGENNPSSDSQQWQNQHSECHMTMWWHNKANQLQQQLEMINNLCQSLLHDRNSNQSPPSISNSLPNTIGNIALMPNYQNAFMMPYNIGNSCVGPASEQTSIPWWAVLQQQQLALQQQQLAAQQQQLIASSWDSNQYAQQMLSQQREIFLLKNSIQNLEEKIQIVNLNLQRINSTPSNISNMDTSHPFRDNTMFTRPQPQTWNNPYSNTFMNPHDSSHANEFNVPWITPANRYNTIHNRPGKKTPLIPPYPDHANLNNHFPPNICFQSSFNEPAGNQSGVAIAPNNINIGNQLGSAFNNCIPSNHLNNQPMQNNINTNAILNLPHPSIHNAHSISMHNIGNSSSSQSLTGQNTALNNQVPPGNRANNYWDNFRSYSRQNLLSGNNKINADSIAQPHNHPLSERSHNTLHITSATAQSQAANTPKRNLNQLGNTTLNQLHDNPNLQVESYENSSRGRRNLSNEAAFNTPPDVLNMNALINSAPLNTEECVNRVNHSVNLNIKKAITSETESSSADSNTNNLNAPKACVQKKKSSSKLPAKNSSNNGNFSMESLHNKNIQTVSESEISDHNLVSTNKPKSKTKLFDLLRDNVYSEVSALISANECRPHFLIQLFRDLQQISSDTLRQRTLESIQEVVTKYLSSVENENLITSEDSKNLHRVSSSNDDQNSQASGSHETGIFSLDTNNEIIRFIFSHHADTCSDELYQSLRAIIYSITKNIPKKIDDSLLACFNKYPNSKLMDIGDELIMIISGITSDINNKTIHTVNSNEPATNLSDPLDEQINIQLCIRNNNEEMHHCSVEHVESNYNDVPEIPSCSNSSMIDINSSATACSSSYNISSNELKIDLIESVETCNGDLAEADQSRHGNESVNSTGNIVFENLPDIVDMDEQTPTEAESEWLRMDRVTTQMEDENKIES